MVFKVNPKTTKEELKVLLDSTVSTSNNRKHFGKLKGVFGDGLSYQRDIRKDEE
jgi:hypothetical protein